MAPKSTTERCQKYRQTHKEVYREKDALRKGNYRQKMKVTPIANEERLRVQRKKKQKYRQRVNKKYSYCYCHKFCDRKNDDFAFS